MKIEVVQIMNKRFLGVKVSSIIAFAVCLAASLAIWMLVKYHLSSEATLNLFNFVS